MAGDPTTLVSLCVLAASCVVVWLALRLKRKRRAQAKLPGPAPVATGVAEGGQKAPVDGLVAARSGFFARIGQLFQGDSVDSSVLSQMEEIVFTSDVGVKVWTEILERLKKELSRSERTNAEQVRAFLKQEILRMVKRPAPSTPEGKPRVILVLGVNGAGKTTTIGKLAAQFKAEGKSVLLGAGDTFRAAAIDQLQVWAERASVPVVRRDEGSDPASVLHDAVSRGVAEGYDVVLCDTAGRLHTRVNLMNELEKVGRVVSKAIGGRSFERWLVVDATTGQNAIRQAAEFREAMGGLDGIVLTKLDGTAKGGVIVSICGELGIPIRYIGVGEKISDLRPFDAEQFVDAMFDRS